jgi:YHS domain-containing protein
MPRAASKPATRRDEAEENAMRALVAAGGRALAALALVVTLLGATPAEAGAINTTLFRNLAIEGTDPVAYFTEGRPVEGSSAYQHEWMGATWRFATAENLELFRADPERYAPQYGGYCAYAVANGYTAKIDPEAWRIEGGRLYLNYSTDVRALWEQDVPGNIAKGDRNWPEIRAELED